MEVPEMLTGPALGDALREAIALKGVTQVQVAAEFGVKQSSVADWLKYGRLHKKHLPKLVAYFADVGPHHWGLPPTWHTESSQMPLYAQESPPRWNAPPVPPRDFSDRHEVSDSDWGLLQDVRLVLGDEELTELRTRAERTRRIAHAQLENVAAPHPSPARADPPRSDRASERVIQDAGARPMPLRKKDQK